MFFCASVWKIKPVSWNWYRIELKSSEPHKGMLKWCFYLTNAIFCIDQPKQSQIFCTSWLLKRFSTSGTYSLIALRPHLSQSGKYDPLAPYAGSHKIDSEMREIYGKHEAEEAWKMKIHPCDHLETSGMRCETLAFLRKWLWWGMIFRLSILSLVYSDCWKNGRLLPCITRCNRL